MSGIASGGALVCSSPAGAPSVVTVSIDDLTVTEAVGEAVFTVALSQPHSSAVTVEIATANVTASGGLDYVVIPLTILTFVPGQTSKTVSVNITNDPIPEYAETFSLRLSNPTNAILADSFGVGTIVDDEVGVDIVVAVSGGISLLRGGPNGVFGAPAFFATGSSPQSVAVGDLNGDGSLDVVTANGSGFGSSNNISVLLGTGAGSFGAPVRTAAGDSPVWVAVRDLNGDGKLDVVTANFGSSDISVLLGHGDGTFETAASFSTSIGGFLGSFPVSGVMGDVNGDGKPDVVTVSKETNSISVLLGAGDGTFGAASVSVALAAVSAVLDDLNADGKLDVVTANREAANIAILIGNGNGTFGEAAYFSTRTANGFRGFSPNAVAIEDVNLDGALDIVTANQSFGLGIGDLSLLEGNGFGAVGEAQLVNALQTRAPTAILAFDLMGFGGRQVVTANAESNNISIFTAFGFLSHYASYPAGVWPQALAVGEFN